MAKVSISLSLSYPYFVELYGYFSLYLEHLKQLFLQNSFCPFSPLLGLPLGCVGILMMSARSLFILFLSHLSLSVPQTGKSN